MSSLRPVTLDIRERPAADAGGRVEGGDVAGAVAQQRHRLLGQGGEDELAPLPRPERAARVGVDDLDQEVVLVDVEAGLGLDALAGHAGADDLREAVDVERLQGQQRLDLGAHGLAPGLGPEDPDPQRHLGGGHARLAQRLPSRAA